MGKCMVRSGVTTGLVLAVLLGSHLFLRQRSAEGVLPGRPPASHGAADWGAGASAPAAVRPDWTLRSAIAEGDAHAVQQLLEAGADGNDREWPGWTPLHMAAVAGESAAAELLLRNGADVNARTVWGLTPLHAAAPVHGETATLEVLLGYGADIAARNSWGKTPLHVAAQRGLDVSSAQLLLAAGAPVEAADNRGDTPLLLAIRSNGPSTVGCSPSITARRTPEVESSVARQAATMSAATSVASSRPRG